MAEADANISIGANGKAFTKEIKAIEKNTDTMANSTTSRLARIGLALQALKSAYGIVATGIGKVSSLASKPISIAADAEQLQLSFRVLLNSEEAALDFMQKLNGYAAETPFSLESISTAAKTLLANTDLGADATLSVIRKLGDVSAMTGKDLNELARNYAKVFNSGMDNEAAKSFEEAGLPVRKLVAEIKGVSFEELKKQISEGTVGIAHLDAALDSATGAGGKLNGATKQLSATYNGLASTLADNVTQAFQRLGEGILPALKPAMEQLIVAVQSAFPVFEALGENIGQWLGDRVEDSAIPAIQELMLWLPEMGDQLELLATKTEAFLDWALTIPNALRSAGEALSDFIDVMTIYFVTSRSWSESSALQRKWKKDDDPEEQIRRRTEKRREAFQNMLNESAGRANERREQARLNDAQRQTQREQAAQQKQLDDARRKADMEKAETARRAAAEAKKAAEDQKAAEQKAADARAKIEEDETRRQRSRAAANLAKQSLAQHEKGLQTAAASLGVQGPVTEKSLTSRIAELNSQGGYENEIARLQELRNNWQQLLERKKAYRETRLAENAELRAQALELSGNRPAAEKLREEEQMRQRINELTEEGMKKDEARRQAMAESKLRRLQALQQDSAGAATIQESRARLGNGGASIRIDYQLAALKQGNNLLNDIRNLLRDRLSAGNNNACVLS